LNDIHREKAAREMAREMVKQADPPDGNGGDGVKVNKSEAVIAESAVPTNG
jgi:hypothetical protein